MDPDDTKNFFAPPSSSYTVTTPGDNTASAGTWLGNIPKLPEKLGTSTYPTNETDNIIMVLRPGEDIMGEGSSPLSGEGG